MGRGNAWRSRQLKVVCKSRHRQTSALVDSQSTNRFPHTKPALLSRARFDFLRRGSLDREGRSPRCSRHLYEGRTFFLRRGNRIAHDPGQTAIAIHNVRLYERAQRQLKRMQGVSEINKAITSTLSLKNVLDVLLEKTELFCPVAVACGVRLFDETSGNMVPMASCHLPFEEWQQDVGNAKGRLTTILMETQRPTAILNMHTGSRRSVNHFARKHGLIS